MFKIGTLNLIRLFPVYEGHNRSILTAIATPDV